MTRPPTTLLPRRHALIRILAASCAAGLATAMRALAQEPHAPALGAAKPGAKSAGAKPWETLPPTPQWPRPDRSGLVPVNGTQAVLRAVR